MLAGGTRLGPYQIVDSLGAGGMGEVYKASDTRLDRIVAIKVLPQALAADPQFRERFDREARTISQITHPNICTLYDVGHTPDPMGTADGAEAPAIDFLVMEYLEGESLTQRLERVSANETGRPEIYVRPFPTGTGKWLVSTNGGTRPNWRRDGHEIFYIEGTAPSPGAFMAVEVKVTGSGFNPSTPKALFDSGFIAGAHGAAGDYSLYAVSPDGQRFLAPRPVSATTEDAAPSSIAVVVDWAAELRK